MGGLSSDKVGRQDSLSIGGCGSVRDLVCELFLVLQAASWDLRLADLVLFPFPKPNFQEREPFLPRIKVSSSKKPLNCKRSATGFLRYRLLFEFDAKPGE